MDSEILYAVENGVGTVTFNRPQARNALTYAMYEGLAAICRDPAAHGDPRVIIVTGAGEKAFASGTDIAQFRAFSGAADALAYEERIEAVLDSIERCPVPTIAAVSGAVTGAAPFSRSPATCGSRPRRRASASRSRGPWATACRWRITPGSMPCSARRW